MLKQVASLTDEMLEILFLRKMYNYRSLSLHSLHKIEFNVEVNLHCVLERVFDTYASPMIF